MNMKQGRKAFRVASSSHCRNFHHHSFPLIMSLRFDTLLQLSGSFLSSWQCNTTNSFRHGKGKEFEQMLLNFSKYTKRRNSSLANGIRFSTASAGASSILITSSILGQFFIRRFLRFGAKIRHVTCVNFEQRSISTLWRLWKP